MAKSLLTTKQNKFITEYVKGKFRGNATKSYIAAGYSPKGARSHACVLLTKRNIQQEIERQQEKLAGKMDLEVQEYINELNLTAFSSVKDLFTSGGKMLEPHQLPDDVARAVKSYEVKVNRWGASIKYTFHDKVKAIGEVATLLGFKKKATDPELDRQVPHVIIFQDCEGEVYISNDPERYGTDQKEVPAIPAKVH